MDIEELLTRHGIKPTANRMIIAEALAMENYPLSMKELEVKLQTIDKSSIFRCLVLFRKHHLVHQVEDGNDIVRYELCMSENHLRDEDLHVHFYCEHCRHTYCLSEISVPQLQLPNGFEQTGVNFMVKGYCPKCSKKQH
ncbi:transcriptional repressor [Prevotella brunnea]|uniref:Transcriptional repressor n=1 Tax=Prevotella brunnea TaxID=2508867 RepID=A0A5C8GKA3_9BACT|nr:transcriptional repressor [Prevotella brunnea]MDR0185199.1 transcriptional repressor [Prevotella brunnea]TXJ62477.1 transcriptional repressor [Prevotella brunnea]